MGLSVARDGRVGYDPVPMRNWLLAAMSAALLCGRVVAAPRIVCENSEWKFGTVHPSQTLKRRFVIANAGDSELKIGRVRMCCGATYALGTNSIPAGTNTTLDVSLSLRGRSGQLRKSIYVVSNDKRRPYLQLKLVGAVVASASLIPRSLLFSIRDANSVLEQDVKLVCQDGVTMAVTNVVSTTGSLSAELLAQRAEGSQVIRVRAVPPFASGTTKGEIRVFTDHAKHRMFRVEVTTIVRTQSGSEPEVSDTGDVSPVIIDYFYEPGCPECIRVRSEVLPKLKNRFEGFYRLNEYDTGMKTNVIRLIAYQEKLGIRSNAAVMMTIDYRYALNGLAAIEKELFSRMDEAVGARLAAGRKEPEPIRIPRDYEEALELARERVQTFTLAAVIIAGLTDGINPCAVATLVFFMSVLAAAAGKGKGERVQGTGLLLVGLAFCFASFVTYTALGFGLLRALHLAGGFESIRVLVELVLIVVLCVLSVLSALDAYRYHVTGDAAAVTVQLPDRIKRLIHTVVRKGLSAHSLFLGGLAAGALVTALESVCTGQVYIPTLVLVAREGATTEAWTYLLIYNAMFIAPLVIVFILTYFGLRTATLLRWSKRNVVFSKILLAALFAGMAVMMLVL